MSYFDLSGFNRYQLEEIKLAIDDGLDVSPMLDKSFDSYQMKEIRKAMENGINPNPILSDKYTGYQMREIWMGIRDGLDYTIYADPRRNETKMHEIRLALLHNVSDVSTLLDLNLRSDQIVRMRFYLQEGVDIYPYITSKTDDTRMIIIYECLKQGIDPLPYISDELEESQLFVIYSAVVDHLPIDKLIGRGYTGEQMYQIQLGYHYKINVSSYSNPKLSYKEMEKIRKKLIYKKTRVIVDD